MEYKQRYILLEEVPGVSRGPRGEEQVVVVKGTLLHRLETCNYQVCALYDLASRHSITLRIREDAGDVLNLSKDEAQLLSAIPVPTDRYTVYTTPGKIGWGLGLKNDDTVYIHLRDVHCVAATVQYKGHLEGYGHDKIMFGVEIKDSKYRGWGNCDGTNKRSTKKEERCFTCDKNCGLFLTIHELQEKPDEKKPWVTPSQEIDRETKDTQATTFEYRSEDTAKKLVSQRRTWRSSSKESSEELEERPKSRAGTVGDTEAKEPKLEEGNEDESTVDEQQAPTLAEDKIQEESSVSNLQDKLYADTGHYSPNPTALDKASEDKEHTGNTSSGISELPDVPRQEVTMMLDESGKGSTMEHGALKLHVPKPVDKQQVSENRVKEQTVKLDYQIAKLSQANKQLEYNLSLQCSHDQGNKILQNFQQQLKQQKEELDQIKAQILLKEEQQQEWWEVSLEEVKIIKVLSQEDWGCYARGKFRGQKVSIKSLNQVILSHFTTEHTRQLMRKMAQIQHPNLLPFLGAVFNEESPNNCLVIINEFSETVLRFAYRDFNMVEEKNKLPILGDIAAALCFLHSQRQSIIHGDVSSENVHLEEKRNNNWKAKLTDFASANLLHPSTKQTTPYSAPEILQGEEQTPKLDVYSFGVLACEVALFCVPPDPEEFPSMLKEVQASQKNQEIYEFAKDCTQPIPSDRPSMSTVLDKLDELIDED